MFTFKFLGLDPKDAPSPYYYGSLPAEPKDGHILLFYATGNRYTVIDIEGKGLVDDGDGENNQKELAFAEIGRGEKVPTLWVRKIEGKLHAEEMKVQGRSFSYEEVKEYSQKNRERRLSQSA